MSARGPETSVASSARHTSVKSTMPTRPTSPTTGRYRKWPFVMSLAASRAPVVVLMTAAAPALVRRDGLRVARQGPVELAAGADAELGEDLAQVVMDRVRADEQPGADLRI